MVIYMKVNGSIIDNMEREKNLGLMVEFIRVDSITINSMEKENIRGLMPNHMKVIGWTTKDMAKDNTDCLTGKHLTVHGSMISCSELLNLHIEESLYPLVNYFFDLILILFQIINNIFLFI